MNYRRRRLITGLVVVFGILLGCFTAYFHAIFSKDPQYKLAKPT